MERSFRIDIAYDGTRYGGWQSQPNAVAVQQKLEESLSDLLGHRIRIIGSGRTDSGVHATMQVAGFRTSAWRAPADRFVPALNCRLPEDIVVRDCREAKPGFHAIRDAVSKRYRYTIRASALSDPFDCRYHWHIPRPMDLEAIREASKYLVGERDFASFQSHGAPRKTTIRHVMQLDWIEVLTPFGRNLIMEIEANGFLYNMVRNIVGSLVVVGSGRKPPTWMKALLESKDRLQAGPMAPACGLCLVYVDYPEELFLGQAVMADHSHRDSKDGSGEFS